MPEREATAPYPWLWVLCVAGLLAIGLSAVTSAVWDPERPLGMGVEARTQVVFAGIAVVIVAVCGYLGAGFWRRMAVPAYVLAVLVLVGMLVLADTPLVPRVKGQANWINLGFTRIQPVEFVKIATVLCGALTCVLPGFNARRPLHCIGLLIICGAPAAVIAKEDFGSAITFAIPGLALAVAAGARWRMLITLVLLAIAVLLAGYFTLPREGPKSYQYRRIQAWLNPDAYALAEGYQQARSERAIGSGRVLGKGFASGDQNRLGWVPEKHTDLISAVIGEEGGFVGTTLLLALYAAFAWCGLAAAARAPDPYGRYVCIAYIAFIVGQACINLSVATRLLPVAGVTLPFLSYGGSSLIGCSLGLGLAIGASRRS